MKGLISQWMEFTIIAVIVSLVLRNAIGFSMVTRSLSKAYTDSVLALKA